MSNAYSGTGALKTDATRTGKRTKQGVLKDGWNSVVRYVKNNYMDGPRQVRLNCPFTCLPSVNWTDALGYFPGRARPPYWRVDHPQRSHESSGRHAAVAHEDGEFLIISFLSKKLV